MADVHSLCLFCVCQAPKAPNVSYLDLVPVDCPRIPMKLLKHSHALKSVTV